MRWLKNRLWRWLKVPPLRDEAVEWIVNDISELGVKIGDRCFFLYKGHSYKGGDWYRPVFKREFGECCHPWTAIEYHEYGNIERGREKVRLPDNFIGYFGEALSEWRSTKTHKPYQPDAQQATECEK